MRMRVEHNWDAGQTRSGQRWFPLRSSRLGYWEQRVERLARRLDAYAPVSATRYFTGALVAMSRVGVATPALQRPREPFFDAMPAFLARRDVNAHGGCRGTSIEKEAGTLSMTRRSESKTIKF